MFERISNILDSRKPQIKKLIYLSEIALLLLGVLTAFLFYSHYEKILGNSASRFLLVLGPYLGIGRPYTDLWEFVPPGFLVFSNIWVFIFGWSMISLKALQVTLLLGIGVSFLFIIRKLFKSIVIEFAVFSSFVVIFYSPLLQTDMLSIELFGTFFALLSLLAFLYIESPVKKLAISGFLFLFASQMKETFSFSVLAMIPYYIYLLKTKKISKEFLKYVFAGILGVAASGTIIFSFLYLIGGISGYQSVLNYKLDRVQPFGTIGEIIAKFKYIELIFSENFLHWHHYVRGLLFLNLIIISYYRVLRIKITKSSKEVFEFLVRLNITKTYSWVEWSGVLFSIGIFIGLIMYGQYSLDTRQIPVAIAFFILVGILLKPIINHLLGISNKKSWKIFFSLLIAIFLVIYLSPQKKIVHVFLHQVRLHISGEILGNHDSRRYYMRTSSMEVSDYIAANTGPSDCILNPYGWEVAETYIYSGRRPCTRHFLANLVVNEKWQIEEYRKEIFNNPPKLILYNLNIIDLNVKSFSENIIDYARVLENCYTIDKKYQKFPYIIASATTYIDLYWAKESLNRDEFKSCFLKYGDPKVGTDIK